ncbi:hypothetical protein COLO4_13592 [Corchorus olitorius]|uniref:DUF4220 domain-containing protein n=1 Tax=Corchorus olitorius TaxID=93759 RepID=A0A1R3JVP6_9ROSI|nr:hypothetical protein COLO4_13592 [Corchorus olitorius]
MEVVPPELRKIWKDWELRGLILFSLFMQLLLVLLGNRRRYIPGLWIRVKAPFLLLHLGGPDTTTAYSLEDTTLWLRRLFELLTQTTVAVYIFLMAWNDSRFSILTIPTFIAGLIKYAKRTWNLWKANKDDVSGNSNDTTHASSARGAEGNNRLNTGDQVVEVKRGSDVLRFKVL